MYAWKCWRETRASFIFLLILSTAPVLLVTLSPGLREQNGWWHFDRSEYLHNPGPTSQLVSIMVLSVLWPSGFLSAVFLGATASGSEIEPGLIYTAAVVVVYMIVRQLVTIPLHLNLPTLFAGPVIWLMNNKPFVPLSAFPWGSWCEPCC
ncbi:MAG: hypothetical protein JWN63_520 [Candidatus Acidoferrum typicum]|jgi:hypothetical protein|nr:hypothetical protein [Candidatus Acidoferrum typicum]